MSLSVLRSLNVQRFVWRRTEELWNSLVTFYNKDLFFPLAQTGVTKNHNKNKKCHWYIVAQVIGQFINAIRLFSRRQSSRGKPETKWFPLRQHLVTGEGGKKSFNRNKPNSRTRLGEGDHLPQPVGVRVKQREGKEEHRETTNDTIGSTLQVGGTSNKLWRRYHPRLSLLVHPCKNISFRPFNYRS